jgi:hypothetical protein
MTGSLIPLPVPDVPESFYLFFRGRIVVMISRPISSSLKSWSAAAYF